MSSEPAIAVEPPDETVNQRILGGLIAFNRATVNRPERQHFNVVLRDDTIGTTIIGTAAMMPSAITVPLLM